MGGEDGTEVVEGLLASVLEVEFERHASNQLREPMVEPIERLEQLEYAEIFETTDENFVR